MTLDQGEALTVLGVLSQARTPYYNSKFLRTQTGIVGSSLPDIISHEFKLLSESRPDEGRITGEYLYPATPEQTRRFIGVLRWAIHPNTRLVPNITPQATLHTAEAMLREFDGDATTTDATT